jgi:hypothetical protein
VVAEEEVVSRPKRTAPKTNLEEQIEFFEPEESGSVYNNLKSSGGFKEEYVEPSNMPQFGDKSTLDMLSKLSDEPTKPVRKRRTTATAKKPTTTRATRTPRTKK